MVRSLVLIILPVLHHVKPKTFLVKIQVARCLLRKMQLNPVLSAKRGKSFVL